MIKDDSIDRLPCLSEASLKKKLFPVYRLGEYVRADWELFFPHFFFFNIIFYGFLTKKKKKKDFVAGRLATIVAGLLAKIVAIR